MSTYVTFASWYCPCNFLQRACSCRLKSFEAWLWELTHPSSSSFEASLPNLAMFWGKQPRGPVLWIQKSLAPSSYSFCRKLERFVDSSSSSKLWWCMWETVKTWHCQPQFLLQILIKLLGLKQELDQLSWSRRRPPDHFGLCRTCRAPSGSNPEPAGICRISWLLCLQVCKEVIGTKE